MPAGAENVNDAIFLNRRRMLSLQKLTETENGIQRRAQFVAHAREKFALRFARPFDFLDPPAFGNVFNRSFVINDRAGFIPDRAGVLAEPDLAAVFTVYFVLEQLDDAL